MLAPPQAASPTSSWNTLRVFPSLAIATRKNYLFPIVFVLLFTAPAFFPRDLLNGTMRSIAQYNPLTYIVEAIRAALHDNAALGSPLNGVIAATALLAGATAIAVWAMRARLRSE